MMGLLSLKKNFWNRWSSYNVWIMYVKHQIFLSTNSSSFPASSQEAAFPFGCIFKMMKPLCNIFSPGHLKPDWFQQTVYCWAPSATFDTVNHGSSVAMATSTSASPPCKNFWKKSENMKGKSCCVLYPDCCRNVPVRRTRTISISCRALHIWTAKGIKETIP